MHCAGIAANDALSAQAKWSLFCHWLARLNAGAHAQDIPLFLTSLIPVESIDEDDTPRRRHRHTGDLLDMTASFMVCADMLALLPLCLALSSAIYY